MRTADRILADGVRPHGLGQAVKSETYRRFHRQQSAEFAGRVAAGPILVADNVRDFVARTKKGYELESFPSLAPPWPSFFIEYPSSSGRERRGVLVTDVTDEPETPLGSFSQARADAGDAEVRWLIDLAMVIELDGRVIGPVAWLVLALDPTGRAVGNCWTLATPKGAQAVDQIVDNDGLPLDPTDWFLASCVTPLQTIAFLHCRNVHTDVVHPSAALSKKHRKKTGKPLVSYKTVRLEVPRKSKPGTSSTGGEGGGVSLHIASGHFAHYGDCHPPRDTCTEAHGWNPCSACGGHDEHGRLFGKHEGVYWVPDHLRGSATVGQVHRDIEVVTR